MKQLLNANYFDGDTSTNYGNNFFYCKVNNTEIKNINDKKKKVLMNLYMFIKFSKIVADGEGASKFITVNVLRSRTEEDKKIAFQFQIHLW